MKNKKVTGVILVALVLALAVGALAFSFFTDDGAKKVADKGESDQELTAADLESFAAWTDLEIFADVPAMRGEQTKVGIAEDYGNKHFVIDVNGSTVSDYQNYLKVLEEAGFVKHSDNGEEGMDGYIYETAFTKDDLTLVVSHVVSLDKTYISAVNGLMLSDYLKYDPSWKDGVSESAVTKVHMLELNNNGNSFVIQLKNGKFVLHDGGISYDAPYLLDYLEELTPGDEKPIIEAWFISHAHADHSGALRAIINNEKYSKRLIVNGIYFTEPPSDVAEEGKSEIWYVTRGYGAFEAEDGGMAKFYRPQLGQRYYFCDITIDVMLTPEQVPLDNYFEKDFNDTSIWLMHNIEGQRFLVAGDAHHTGMRKVISMYDESYFELDVFAVLHHGINVYEYFTDFCTIKTALYTNWRVGSLWVEGTAGGNRRPDLVRTEDNAYLQESVAECISHGDGTVVLTFPYKVGEAEIMEPCDWRYNRGKPYRLEME